MSEVILAYNEKLIARKNALKNMKAGNPALKNIEDQSIAIEAILLKLLKMHNKVLNLTKAEISKRSKSITDKNNSLPNYERDFVTI
jgi:hypothetical protein